MVGDFFSVSVALAAPAHLDSVEDKEEEDQPAKALVFLTVLAEPSSVIRSTKLMLILVV